ncbi:hypothetical protein S245_037788, partial [Arachis hypogaea]
MFIYLFLMNLLSSRNGFQRPDKIKDSHRQSSQLEDLTQKMRECKRLIKEFDREIKDGEGRNSQEVNKQLNDENQSMIKELNSDVALRKTEVHNKKIELFDMGAGEPTAEENVELASGSYRQVHYAFPIPYHLRCNRHYCGE